MKNMQDWR